MPVIVPCPVSGFDEVDNAGRPVYWIEHPAAGEWTGNHLNQADRALEEARKNGLPKTATNFMVSMSLLDDWNLPGISGNPEKWKFERIRAEVITWINDTVLRPYNDLFVVKKNSSSEFMNGHADIAETPITRGGS